MTSDEDQREKIIERRLIDLCLRVRSEVRPLLGTARAKGISGTGASGDATFGIDEVAENVVEEELSGWNDIAYYTEDRGLTVRGEPELLLVIDPIDGTRPAAAGLEACCVSIAVAPYRADEKLTLGDVFLGIVVEIKGEGIFLGSRGSGARITCGESQVPIKLSQKTDTSSIFWTIGFRGRPALPLVLALGRLIDKSSVKGGVFDLGSATFCISRVLTGEMDVYVDAGDRMARDSAKVREEFLEVGGGRILNNAPYDLAAIVLVAEEAGALCSDAYGESLAPYPLLPEEGSEHISCVVAGNQELLDRVLEEVNSGMERMIGFQSGEFAGGR